MKILHITVHMGGGAGKAIQSLSSYSAENFGWDYDIALLDMPIQTHHLEKCIEKGIKVHFPDCRWDMLMDEADAVIINWWSHPKMLKFLANLPKVPTRLLLWSHINGCVYPFLPADFLNCFHKVLFTTPYSLENPFWKINERDNIREKSFIIYGSGDYSESFPHKKDYSTNGKDFVIGYVGTLSKAKIHPKTAVYCAAVKQAVPNAKFIFVGESNDILEKELIEYGLKECIEFSGYVSDVIGMLSTFDAFGYLLNEANYATTENAVLEAMAYALPVVLMNQGTEKFIIDHGKTGFLVSNPQEYASAMRKLAGSSVLRQSLGVFARKSVTNRFSLSKNFKNFRSSLDSALDTPKEVISFKNVLGKSPYDWFMTFITPKDKAVFSKCLANLSELPEDSCREIYLEENKSSVRHFRRYFFEDKRLIRLEALLDGYKKG